MCITSVLSNEPKKIPKGVVLAMLNNMFKQGVQISQPEIQNHHHGYNRVVSNMYLVHSYCFLLMCNVMCSRSSHSHKNKVVRRCNGTSLNTKGGSKYVRSTTHITFELTSKTSIASIVAVVVVVEVPSEVAALLEVVSQL